MFSEEVTCLLVWSNLRVAEAIYTSVLDDCHRAVHVTESQSVDKTGPVKYDDIIRFLTVNITVDEITFLLFWSLSWIIKCLWVISAVICWLWLHNNKRIVFRLNLDSIRKTRKMLTLNCLHWNWNLKVAFLFWIQRWGSTIYISRWCYYLNISL